MKRDPEKPKETFSTIGKELQREIALLRQEGTPVFLLATRKGYATSVICRDCGSAVPCHACASPVTLRMKGGKRFLFCLRCRTSRSALETCGTCGSWNLIELGIGVERVYQEAEALFGKEAVLLFDATTAPTHKKAKQIIHAFEEKRKKGLAPVLVGTERAIHYLHHTPLYVGVVSLDSLLSIPEWKAHERAFALLTVLSEKASQIGIQTRRPEEPLLRFAMLGLRSDMRTEEITMRKKFKYPPVATLITITSVGEKKSVRVEGAKVRAYLESWNPIELYTEVSATRSKHTMILALPKEGLEKDTALRDKLLALPPAMAVRVNPESLWE